jgi:hypothetical protein
MTYYTKIADTLVKVVDNKEQIVGRIYSNPSLLSEIVCLLNEEV